MILKPGHHLKYLPYAFTEHWAIMAANVLNSPRASQMSVSVVRAFVRMRRLVEMNTVMAEKLAELERRVSRHDEAIRSVVQTLTVASSVRYPRDFRFTGGAGLRENREHDRSRRSPRPWPPSAGRGRCPRRVDENPNPESWNSEGLHAQRCPVPF